MRTVINMEKPCKILKYCPYGSLVEVAPLAEEQSDRQSCNVFGHICPVFIYSELIEDMEENE